jgi:hypothetical protein
MPGVEGMTQRRRVGLDVRQHAWSSMRVFKVFTTEQIEATAGITRDNLRKYIKALHKSSYLRIARPKQNGRSQGHTVWRLIRDSGARAPIVRMDGSGVYDPNHDVVYPYREEVATRDG